MFCEKDLYRVTLGDQIARHIFFRFYSLYMCACVSIYNCKLRMREKEKHVQIRFLRYPPSSSLFALVSKVKDFFSQFWFSGSILSNPQISSYSCIPFFFLACLL